MEDEIRKIRDAQKQSRKALYWSLASLAVSVIALVIQILGRYSSWILISAAMIRREPECIS